MQPEINTRYYFYHYTTQRCHESEVCWLLNHEKSHCFDTTSCPCVILCFLFRLQISQQAFQRLLVVVMLLPPGEVADMFPAPNISDPGLRCLHHALIEADRKRHALALLFFSSAVATSRSTQLLASACSESTSNSLS
jgi:hypothetical protein